MQTLRILGVDPGSQTCGYGVIERLSNGRVVYVECGVVEPARRSTLADRLAEIGAGLREVIAELCPTQVAVEGVFHGINARTALQLGHSRGVALLCAAEQKLSVFEYAPATIKRQVAGHGAASKMQVQEMVRHLCALRRVPRLDASDALAVAICHAFRSRGNAQTVPTVARP